MLCKMLSCMQEEVEGAEEYLKMSNSTGDSAMSNHFRAMAKDETDHAMAIVTDINKILDEGSYKTEDLINYIKDMVKSAEEATTKLRSKI